MMEDDVIAVLRESIEKRIREQLARHYRVDPTIDPRKIIDIQMDQERERLQRNIEKLENEGKDNIAEVLESIVEWLPELAHDLKRR